MNSWTTRLPDGRPHQVIELTPSETFAQSQSFRMFLSHRSGHENDTIYLAGQINEYGIDTFVAPRDLRPGDDWELNIERAIADCDALLAYCPPDFGDGDWTTKEVILAGKFGKPILPIWIGGRPTGPVTKYHALQLNGGRVPVLEIVRRCTAFPPMTEALVGAIERCAQQGSFELANRLARALSFISYMSDEQADRLIKTYNQKSISNHYGNTNQIRASYNFGWRGSSPAQSVITHKINELTSLSVCHGSDGDICDAPPRSKALSQRAADKPAFTREIIRDSCGEERYTSTVTRTQIDRRIQSPVYPR